MKEAKVFLRGLRPDRALLEKYNLIRPMISGGNIKGVAKYIAYRQLTMRTNLTRRETMRTMSPRRTTTFGSHSRRRTQHFYNMNVDIDDLGPIENYMHLIDPVLRQEMEKIDNPAENILDAIKTLEEFDLVAKECDKILENAENMREGNLNQMIENLAKIYKKLDMDSENIPLERLRRIEELKKRALEKRNILKKKKLKLSSALIGYLDKAFKYNLLDSLPRVSRIKKLKPIDSGSEKSIKRSIVSNKTPRNNLGSLGIPTGGNGKRRRSVMAKIGQEGKFVTMFVDRLNSRGTDIMTDEELSLPSEIGDGDDKSKIKKSKKDKKKKSKKKKKKDRKSISLFVQNEDKSNAKGGKDIKEESEKDGEEKVFEGFSDFNNFLNDRRTLTESDVNEGAVNPGQPGSFKRQPSLQLPFPLSSQEMDKMAFNDPKGLSKLIMKETNLTPQQKQRMLENLKIYAQFKQEDGAGEIESPTKTEKTVEVLVPETALFENIGRIGLSNVNDLGFGVVEEDSHKYSSEDSQMKNSKKNPKSLRKKHRNLSRSKFSSSHLDITKKIGKGSEDDSSEEDFLDPLYSENKIFKLEDLLKKNKLRRIEKSDKKELTNLLRNVSPQESTGGINKSDWLQNLKNEAKLQRKSQREEMIAFNVKKVKKVREMEARKRRETATNSQIEGYNNLVEARNWINTIQSSDFSAKSFLKNRKLLTNNRKETTVVTNNIYKQLSGDLSKSPDDFRNNANLILQNQALHNQSSIERMKDTNKNNRRVFSRASQFLPFKILNKKSLRSRIEVFMMIWLSDNLSLSEDKVKELFENDQKRKAFFSINNNIFEFLIEGIMKDPVLSKRATDFVFKKQEVAKETEKLAKQKRKEIKQRKRDVKQYRTTNDKFLSSTALSKFRNQSDASVLRSSTSFLKNRFTSRSTASRTSKEPRFLFNLTKPESYLFSSQKSASKLPVVNIAHPFQSRKQEEGSRSRNAYNSTSSNFRKKKMFEQASVTAGAFFTKKKMPGTIRRHFSKTRSKVRNFAMPSLRSSRSGVFLNSKTRFKDQSHVSNSKNFKGNFPNFLTKN